MTALLFILFGGAAILAAGSMAATASHYAAAVLAIVHQQGYAANLADPRQRKHLVYARRLKAQSTWRARARARRAGRAMRRDGKIAAKHGKVANGVRKTVHNEYKGFRLALLSYTLILE